MLNWNVREACRSILMDALQFLLYKFNSCTDICINDCFMLNSSPATSEILITFDGI